MDRNQQSLFRQEVISNRLNRALGKVSINVPLNYIIICFLSVIFLLGLIIFLFFTKVAEKIIVRGYIDTEQGVTAIYPEFNGIILQTMIDEGDHVKKNDVLFVIAKAELEKAKEVINNLNQQVITLKREQTIKNEHYQAVLTLYNKKYISASQLNNVEADLLEISNKIKSIDLEIIKFKQSQSQLVKSPIDGVVTNVLFKTGQFVDLSKSLLQILPDNAKLIVRLYVPAQNIGFLKKGNSIALKYDAYPAQRFGIYNGVIKEINLTILTDNREDKPIKIGQPYYKIKAELEKSYVTVYGKKISLSHGLTLSAILSGDKKTMWQWILDPIYSYYGDKFL